MAINNNNNKDGDGGVEGESATSRVVLDTNVLIDAPESVLMYDEVILPYTVLAELDNHKRNPDLKRAAQSAIKCINDAINKGKVTIVDLPTGDDSSPDERIVSACKEHNATFITQDIGAKCIAKAQGVPVGEELEDESIDYTYTGYIEIDASDDTDYEMHWKHIKEAMPIEVVAKFDVVLLSNQYLIVNRVGGAIDIWREFDGKVIRISQSIKPLRSCGLIDSPLDAVQQCAVDAVMNPDVPLTVIDGGLGTGKTILSLMGALATTRGQKNYRYYKKVLVTRPPITTDRKLELGFLPGDLASKLGDWVGGVKSNLKFLYEKDLETSLNKSADSIFEESFEMINLESIQGVSLHDVILLVDEYQLLNTDTLKLVLSRIAQGAKVVLVGDTYGQTYGVNRSNEGFKTLYRYLGKNVNMSFIRLENIYRSKLSEFVDEVFK
jgi:PhoH-like ATPase